MHFYLPTQTLKYYVVKSGVHSVNITGIGLLMRKPLPSVPSPYQWARSGLCVIKTYQTVYSQLHCLSVNTHVKPASRERKEKLQSQSLKKPYVTSLISIYCCSNLPIAVEKIVSPVKTMGSVMLQRCSASAKCIKNILPYVFNSMWQKNRK